MLKAQSVFLLKAFSTLVSHKPEKLKFINFSVGGSIGDNTSENWVRFTSVAEDPIVFEDYLSTLRMEKMFKNVSITEISTDATGYKKRNTVFGYRMLEPR